MLSELIAMKQYDGDEENRIVIEFDYNLNNYEPKLYTIVQEKNGEYYFYKYEKDQHNLEEKVKIDPLTFEFPEMRGKCSVTLLNGPNPVSELYFEDGCINF